MTDAARYRASDRVIFTPLADGTGVLLDLDTKYYFTLNATGVEVWRVLGDVGATLGELSAALTERFEVDADVAKEDVATLLTELAAESLVFEESA